MPSRSLARRFTRRRSLPPGDARAEDAYGRLADLAGLLGASVAYVDRATIEAHLERPLSAAEWTAVARQLRPMAFDEHVGEAGTLRTDWIEDLLSRAGLPGRWPGPPPGVPDDRPTP